MFLSLVHLRELRCRQCSVQLATSGARSFIVDASGDPVYFSAEDPPAQLVVQLTCANEHANALRLPDDLSAEEAMNTPEEAPISTDACLISGTTESGKAL